MMKVSIGFAALAAVALLAGCSRGAPESNEANGSASNAAAEAPANSSAAEEPAEESNASAAESTARPDRPLPDFASFEMSEAQRDSRFSRTYASCMDSAGSTADYRDCSSAEFRRVEREMERALAAAEEGMSESGREQLRADQQRWRAGLPAFCQSELEEEGAEGGSMDLLTLDNCSLTQAVRRTLWLESLR